MIVMNSLCGAQPSTPKWPQVCVITSTPQWTHVYVMVLCDHKAVTLVVPSTHQKWSWLKACPTFLLDKITNKTRNIQHLTLLFWMIVCIKIQIKSSTRIPCLHSHSHPHHLLKCDGPNICQLVPCWHIPEHSEHWGAAAIPTPCPPPRKFDCHRLVNNTSESAQKSYRFASVIGMQEHEKQNIINHRWITCPGQSQVGF